jgi:hypothetical protein
MVVGIVAGCEFGSFGSLKRRAFQSALSGGTDGIFWEKSTTNAQLSTVNDSSKVDNSLLVTGRLFIRSNLKKVNL